MKTDELTMPFNERLIDLPNPYHVINRYPLTIDSDSYVADAISLMNQKSTKNWPLTQLNSRHWHLQNTSCILVVDSGQLLGIFTKQDIVRLAASGINFSEVKMAQVMTQPVITMKFSQFQNLFTALSLLQQHQIGHLPIVNDEGELLGLVTTTSLLQGFHQLQIVSIGEALQKPQDELKQQIKMALRCPTHRHFQLVEATAELELSYECLQQEIIERQKVEAALLESEAKFRHFAENHQAVIWIKSTRSQQLLYVNPAYEKVWGRSCESLRSHPESWMEAVHPEDRDRIQAGVETYTLGEPTEIEYRIVRPDGSVRWIWDRCFPMSSEAGKIYCYAGMAEDITARKQAEESLRQSEERLSLALTAARMGLFDWNLVSNAAIWSANMGPLYGLPCGTPCPSLEEFLNLVHSEDRQLFTQAVQQSIEQKQEFAIEYRVVWPDGSIHWLSSKAVTYCDKLGKPIRMVGTTRDINDRKQAEIALRDSEERYRSVVTALQEGVVLNDRQGTIIACNASAEKILGLSQDQILGRVCGDGSWHTIYEDGSPFPGEEHPAMVTLHTGKPCTNVVMGVHKPNGQISWIAINSQPLVRENETSPYAVVTSFSDISDRKQAEQKIREQAALLDIATDAIFVKDLKNQILFWNQGAERLYGWSAQESLGKSTHDLLSRKLQISPKYAEAFKIVLQTGVWHGELEKVTKCDKDIIVESRWTLMRDAAGQPKSILIVDTDITQKKQLEEQFFRAQRLESLGTLAGGIAHDLNNILTPIMVSSQILKTRIQENPERSQQLIEIVENNAKRGAALVKQVLSFARGFKGERTIVQLKHLIADIILIGKQTFPKSIEFTTHLSSDLWAVSGDITQLHQVLMNLVVNARDAMPDGGNITITAENVFIDEAYASMNLNAKVGHYIQVKVLDTGVGMPPKILDKIFEPFFTTKAVGTGTGLGLATVLGITKSHGGFITVSSKVGQGSQFKLFLPAVQATPDLNTEELEIPQGNGEQILVVDDEPQICEIVKMILENHNYKILTACNGIEAIALYAQQKHQISAVLMDMMMPEMDGATAIRTMQIMKSNVQIIASSGLSSTEGLTTASEMGVQQVLPKPFTAKELLHSLHNVFHRGK
jgi:PAS domain S-box-containing protein